VEGGGSLSMVASAGCRRHPRPSSSRYSVETSQLVEGSAEPAGRLERPESSHRPIPLLDPSMVLFNPAIQVSVRPVLHVCAQFFPNRPRVGVVTIGRNPIRCDTGELERLGEEGLGCSHVPLPAQPAIHQVPIPVDGSVQVAPLATDLDVGLVYVPAAAHSPFSMTTESIADHRPEPCFPSADRLMSELEAALEEHLAQISKAEFIAQPPADHEEDDVGGELEEVERGPGSIVESASTGTAPVAGVTEESLLLELDGRVRRTVGT